jgi:hypothetical protein
MQYKITEYQLLDKLPHGSGIDCDWRIEYKDGFLYASNSWHAMDPNGYYCGYVDFTAKIDELGQLVDVDVNEHQIEDITSDYEDSADAPYLDDLDDYLFETINYNLNAE